MSSSPNLKEAGERLHRSLLAGSLTAPSETAETFLQPLIKSLAKEFKDLRDPHLIDSAAADALINYFEHPGKFDPTRASLFWYLRIRARAYLLNSLDRPESAQKVVELEESGAVYQIEDQSEPDAETALVSRAVQLEIMQQVEKYITDPADLLVVSLMIEGVRETAKYAEVLGISDRPPMEQRKTVKQHKDRIKKVIERRIRDKMERRR
jgi:RNA polymerase sigma-70 factor (ECF subfamily)